MVPCGAFACARSRRFGACAHPSNYPSNYWDNVKAYVKRELPSAPVSDRDSSRALDLPNTLSRDQTLSLLFALQASPRATELRWTGQLLLQETRTWRGHWRRLQQLLSARRAVQRTAQVGPAGSSPRLICLPKLQRWPVGATRLIMMTPSSRTTSSSSSRSAELAAASSCISEVHRAPETSPTFGQLSGQQRALGQLSGQGSRRLEPCRQEPMPHIQMFTTFSTRDSPSAACLPPKSKREAMTLSL
jgi:hypothetical protein